ncbi:MAG: dephospho-CoA kinase [Armatimonadota bacterium]
MHVWGLTGGIACGKSTVLELLRREGAAVRSADDDAREAFDEPPVRAALARLFPDAVGPDGLDRAAIAAAVFADPERRKALEAVVHPAVRRRMRQAIAAARANDSKGLLVYEVPLLYEGGLESWFDGVVVVAASMPTRLARLAQRARRTGAPDDGSARIAAQMPLEAKIGRADRVVTNDGEMVQLEREVARIVDEWRAAGFRCVPGD